MKKKYISSHPEIEAQLIALYEKKFSEADTATTSSNFFISYRVMFEEFEKISPVYLENFSFGWYDTKKENTDSYERVWAYRRLVSYFNIHNEFKSKVFWIDWAHKRTYRYCEKTQQLFKNYVENNFPLKDCSWQNFLEGIQTEADKQADSLHLVTLINDSVEWANKENSKTFQGTGKDFGFLFE